MILSWYIWFFFILLYILIIICYFLSYKRKTIIKNEVKIFHEDVLPDSTRKHIRLMYLSFGVNIFPATARGASVREYEIISDTYDKELRPTPSRWNIYSTRGNRAPNSWTQYCRRGFHRLRKRKSHTIGMVRSIYTGAKTSVYNRQKNHIERVALQQRFSIFIRSFNFLGMIFLL